MSRHMILSHLPRQTILHRIRDLCRRWKRSGI
ncbi:MAG: hypothetical protein K2J76_07030 [Oscillospiraceae bacterium]|nr:hypothetical protein [Oscillospiraceae bacterium]